MNKVNFDILEKICNYLSIRDVENLYYSFDDEKKNYIERILNIKKIKNNVAKSCGFFSNNNCDYYINNCTKKNLLIVFLLKNNYEYQLTNFNKKLEIYDENKNIKEIINIEKLLYSNKNVNNILVCDNLMETNNIESNFFIKSNICILTPIILKNCNIFKGVINFTIIHNIKELFICSFFNFNEDNKFENIIMKNLEMLKIDCYTLNNCFFPKLNKAIFNNCDISNLYYENFGNLESLTINKTLYNTSIFNNVKNININIIGKNYYVYFYFNKYFENCESLELSCDSSKLQFYVIEGEQYLKKLKSLTLSMFYIFGISNENYIRIFKNLKKLKIKNILLKNYTDSRINNKKLYNFFNSIKEIEYLDIFKFYYHKHLSKPTKFDRIKTIFNLIVNGEFNDEIIFKNKYVKLSYNIFSEVYINYESQKYIKELSLYGSSIFCNINNNFINLEYLKLQNLTIRENEIINYTFLKKLKSLVFHNIFFEKNTLNFLNKNINYLEFYNCETEYDNGFICKNYSNVEYVFFMESEYIKNIFLASNKPYKIYIYYNDKDNNKLINNYNITNFNYCEMTNYNLYEYTKVL